ncbi:MAG: metalloregulator ArsR/SmtB family transcription factor [Myxococcales bacterium]|nr:metalloregulator ArsR/SmtB family transcription factor [Myxococcales bacterium]MDD9965475.1 metalloregulator ArsR/SmtB family transcription factor [Myxococcales bacterium]
MSKHRSRALSQAEAERLATTFKALSDPGRLTLVSLLANEELCVHELAERVGREQTAVSHQLRILRDRQLVQTRRNGRHIYYELADSHVRDVFELALEHIREER